MSFSTVLIISLAAGVILVVGGGLMMYMGNLVKSAYEIKVQINTDVEERLTKMAEDLDKKSRWIKRDLLEEIDKIKTAMQTDNSRRLDELSAPLLKRIESLEAAVRSDSADFAKAIETDRQLISNLDTRLKSLNKLVRKTDDTPATGKDGDAPPAEAPLPGGDPAAKADPAKAAAPKPAGPSAVGSFLQDLG